MAQNHRSPEGLFAGVSSFRIGGLFLLLLLLVLGGSLMMLQVVKSRLKSSISDNLTISLDSTLELVRVWEDQLENIGRLMVRDSRTQEKLLALIEKSSRGRKTREELIALEELAWLRSHLGALCKQVDYVGFVVFDETGYQVGALLDGAIGGRELMKASDFFRRAMTGEVVLSLPFWAEISLPDATGVMVERRPTMFHAFPIKDENGTNRGVLGLRLRPEVEFSKIFKGARTHQTGEAYAFDQDGVMISDTRFHGHLRTIGMIPDDMRSSSILRVGVRDPGGNLTGGYRPSTPPDQWPLTLMANSAIRGERSLNVEGYNDYRGVPVVGAWAWLPRLGFGVTKEVDYSEAYGPFLVLRDIFTGLVVGLLLFLLVSFYLILKKRKVESALDLSDHYYQAVVKQSSDPIIAIDSSGAIQNFNPAAERVFGYAAKEVVGDNVNRLMPEPHYSAGHADIQRFLGNGISNVLGVRSEVTGRHKDGGLIPLELSVSEIKVDTTQNYCAILRDISEQKKYEKELLAAKEAAEEASQVKSEFMSRMSHELRTPMNAILGFAQLMNNDPRAPLSDDHRENIEEIIKAGERLLFLINEILDLADIEAGEITLSMEAVNIRDLAQEISEFMIPVALQNSVEIINESSFDEEPIYFFADRVRLKQTLVNIIANAIKYNRENGKVWITCGARGGATGTVSIKDTGVGISPDLQKRLFKPFDRLEADQRGIEGTGIGLALSRRMIEMMEGKIYVQSEPGKGSCFTIEMQTVQPSEIEVSGVLDTGDGLVEDGKPRFTVLCVEDNPANQRLMKKVFTPENGYRLMIAHEANLGIELARAHNPNLILMDINLPGMDGVAALRELRLFRETKSIPVVAISANANEKDVDRAMIAGFKHYLRKPLQLEKLMAVVHMEFDE